MELLTRPAERAFRRASETSYATLLARYANLGELLLALARVAFRVVLFTRYLLIAGPFHGDPPSRVAFSLASLLLTFAFSAWAALLAQRRLFAARDHLLSAGADVALCFIALFCDVLWPDAAYAGLLHTPDVTLLPTLVAACALRLSRGAILASSAASLGALLALVELDVLRNSSELAYRGADVQMLALVICVAGTGAYFVSWVMRGALRRLAREADRVSWGRRYLRELLREQHDIGTHLSAARLHLDLLLAESSGTSSEQRAAVAIRALAAAGSALDAVRRRALGALVASEELSHVDLASTLAEVVTQVHDCFPAINFRTSLPRGPLQVDVHGGLPALSHVLSNLLVNACEGSGQARASSVAVRVERDSARPNFLKIDVLDDGPGFPRELLRSGASQGLSSKGRDRGLGLAFVMTVVNESDAELVVSNRACGGASVTVWFRESRSDDF